MHETRTVLGKQINHDFQTALGDSGGGGGGNQSFVPTKQLAEACLVVNVLAPQVKKSLLKWLVSRELAEYGIIFAEGEEGTWIDKIDNR